MPYAEVEIGLHGMSSGAYQVEVRFTDPNSEALRLPARGEAHVDLARLVGLQSDPEAYGSELARQLFQDADLLREFREIKNSVQQSGLSLRLRLMAQSPELHGLRWELLRDPETGDRFSTSEKILFSRFMSSQSWSTVKLRPKAALSALVAVSAPSNLADYELAPVKREAEIARAQTSLQGIHVDFVSEFLTLETLQNRLRADVDILYLVCHGALGKGGMPVLYLEDAEGKTAPVEGRRLVERLQELPQLPRLVVLASCESGGTELGLQEDGRPSAEVALAPRLAEAGVPAIVAMQGKVSMETIETAMPAFFRELVRDGQIDRAMSVARGTVRDRPDHWMPALLMRLKGGRVWYEPGFGEGESDSVKWQGLVSAIKTKQLGDREESCFTPVVGMGLATRVYGAPEDLAQRLALAGGFPMAPYQRSDLPRVAQYVLVSQSSREYALDSVKQQMRQALLERHKSSTPGDLAQGSLSELLKTVGAKLREDENDSYRILAELPATVYINACPDNLLSEALIEAGKEPQPVYAKWKDNLEPEEPTDVSVERPLVYHVLGYWAEPQSIVLTEDDYFDYLIGISRNKNMVPTKVRRAVSTNSLLFLGFQLTDWSFRVLFRLIMGQAGGSRRELRPHAAVQVDPEGTSLINVNQARRYLEAYFGTGNINNANIDIDIFWGNGDDFLKELRKKRTELERVPAGPSGEF